MPLTSITVNNTRVAQQLTTLSPNELDALYAYDSLRRVAWC